MKIYPILAINNGILNMWSKYRIISEKNKRILLFRSMSRAQPPDWLYLPAGFCNSSRGGNRWLSGR